LKFNGLHDFISQKKELFIPTAVRTSNPAFFVKENYIIIIIICELEEVYLLGYNTV
jgi:hypothetical protein